MDRRNSSLFTWLMVESTRQTAARGEVDSLTGAICFHSAAKPPRVPSYPLCHWCRWRQEKAAQEREE